MQPRGQLEVEGSRPGRGLPGGRSLLSAPPSRAPALLLSAPSCSPGRPRRAEARCRQGQEERATHGSARPEPGVWSPGLSPTR